jgi:hypothetical protein
MTVRIIVAVVAATLATSAFAQPKNRPPAALTVTNGTDQTATEVVVAAGDQSVKLAKPLAPKAKATLRLPAKMKGCIVSVSASFEDEGQAEIAEHNVCKDRSVRFTN